jgi:hypothetical protein
MLDPATAASSLGDILGLGAVDGRWSKPVIFFQGACIVSVMVAPPAISSADPG